VQLKGCYGEERNMGASSVERRKKGIKIQNCIKLDLLQDAIGAAPVTRCRGRHTPQSRGRVSGVKHLVHAGLYLYRFSRLLSRRRPDGAAAARHEVEDALEGVKNVSCTLACVSAGSPDFSYTSTARPMAWGFCSLGEVPLVVEHVALTNGGGGWRREVRVRGLGELDQETGWWRLDRQLREAEEG
jgi:hypothetical protein